MNENETVEVVETQNNDTELDLGSDTQETVETEETQSEEAPKESPEDKLARLERQAKQLRKKLGIEDKPKVKQEPKSKINNEKTDFDWGEKAFLRSYDIKGADEVSLVKQWIDRTGDSLDSVVEDDIFQAKLSKLREARTVKQALPNGSKRAPITAKDSMDYHIDKYNQTGELPSDFKTRSAVLETIVKNKKSAF